MNQVIIAIVFLFFPCLLFAQPVVLTGKVTDKASNRALSGVIVTLRPAGKNTILTFAQTTTEGNFEIKLQAIPDNQVLYFSIMGFAHQVLPLKLGQYRYDVQLTEQTTLLKEVVVKALGIREKGDTIVYTVSKFANAQDKTLADVLKKMPGIEISESGAIKYNGKDINKFYIEGKDMLEGRYGMATNNIRQQDVGSVEVMENHQSVKALENISFSQNPAINIRLKENAQSRWAGTMKLGAGFTPFLWNDELFAMRFTRKSQILNTYKTNNIGTDVSSDMTDFSIEEFRNSFSKSYELSNYVDVNSNVLTQIDSKRSRFNKTHMVSTNNLWSIGKKYDLTSEVTYLNNRLNSDCYSRTTYYLKDEKTNVTEEDEQAYSRQNQLTADLSLNTNTSKVYINNKLSTDMEWNNINLGTVGTYFNRQESEMPYRKISNDLDLIKRNGNKVFELCSLNMFQQKPQHLTVERDGNTQQQHIRSSAFFTNTYTSLSFVLSPLSIAIKTGAVGIFRSIKSELTGISDTLGLLNNYLSMSYMNLYASPEVTMNTGSFEAGFGMPLSYMPCNYHDKLVDNRKTANVFFLSPSLYFRYFFTSRLSLSASGSIRKNAINEQSFYSGLILSNYRNLMRGYVDYRTGSNQSIDLNLSYRNPLEAFFANFNSNLTWNYSPRSSSRQFMGDYILNSYLSHNNYMKYWFVSGKMSKGIDAVKGTISLGSSYQSTDTSIYQNDVKTDYVSGTWTITPKFNAQFTQWLNMTYELEYSRNFLRLKDADTNTHLNNISEAATCNIVPSKTWYLKLKYEHYRNEITADIKKNLVLADADFTYCYKGGWEFNLAVMNIFNQKTYSYRMYNGVMSLYESYKIRPRNIMLNIFFSF